MLSAAALSLSLLAPTAALAQRAAAPPLRGTDLLAALRAGGCILYFRHAETGHGQSDQRVTSVEDCTTQRDLTDRGHDHSRAIGEVICALGQPMVDLAAPGVVWPWAARSPRSEAELRFPKDARGEDESDAQLVY